MYWREYDYFPTREEDPIRQMRAYWADHWKSVARFHEDHELQPVWATIRDQLPVGCSILEAGCGIPDWVAFFRKRGHQAVGVDYALAPLEIGARIEGGLALVNADLRRLPFPDEFFDRIVSFGAVEHAPEGPDLALCEMKRVLSPSGRLLCSVPCLNWERTVALPWLILRDWLKRQSLLRRLAGKTKPFRFYQYVWSPGAYRRILNRCGFHVLDLRPFGGVRHAVWLRPVEAVLQRLVPFFCPHMMMAVCEKA